MLADLSGTILTLLGISGIGAIAAKGTDQKRNTISAENRAWLLRKNWIPTAKTPVDPSNASWRDFFTTNGEFDVYRYQSFVFSFVVVVALVVAGVTQLSTFSIPETVLGILGLSQAVYIGGKLVTTTNIGDLNSAIVDLRDRERKFRDDATVKKSGSASPACLPITLIRTRRRMWPRCLRRKPASLSIRLRWNRRWTRTRPVTDWRERRSRPRIF